jgi:hypothetical protein
MYSHALDGDASFSFAFLSASPNFLLFFFRSLEMVDTPGSCLISPIARNIVDELISNKNKAQVVLNREQ